jgi:hypothetical protein
LNQPIATYAIRALTGLVWICGALGSVGNNHFGKGFEYAIDLGGPYDVFAKQDLWSGTAIESRIHDRLDDQPLGRVQY